MGSKTKTLCRGSEHYCTATIEHFYPAIDSFTNSQSGLLKLLQWLLQYGCQLVAAESTGVYW